MSKKRLDDLLVEKGLADGRKEATALILSGVVLVNEQRIDKPGTRVDASSDLRLKSERSKYVSRGGLKLEKALGEFRVQVKGKVCLDLGASTGGFTDCLLQQDARKVYAFDVGHGQLDWKLQQDPRVVPRDRINVRHLSADLIDDPVDLITIDLSFISLRLILPVLKQFSQAEIIALVKPQFEAGRDEVDPGGLIESVDLQKNIVERIKTFARQEGFKILAEIPSPIQGRKGNQEYFLYLKSEPQRRRGRSVNQS